MNFTYYNEFFNNLSFVKQIGQDTFLGYSVPKLLFIFIVFCIVASLGVLVSYVLNRFLIWFYNKYKSVKGVDKNTETSISKLSKALPQNIYQIFILIALRISLDYVGILINPYNKILDTILILFVTLGVVKIASFLIETVGTHIAAKTESTIDDALLPLFHKVALIVLFLMGILAILKYWGINLTPILGGLGIIGLAVSLGIQDMLKNFFGAVSLLTDASFKVGDRISVPSLSIDGTVMDIGLRSTKILTWDNEVFFIPNGLLSNSTVKNFALPNPKMRCVVMFETAYGYDVEKIKNLILIKLKNTDNVMKDPQPNVEFINMGSYSLKFQVKFFVDDFSKYYDMKLKAIDLIYKELVLNNIEIPYPKQVIYLENNINKEVLK